MLANYDAKAIADVLGLAFVLQPKRVSRGARTGAVPRVDRDIVIRVADKTMLVVAAKGGRRPTTSALSSRSDKRKPAATRRSLAVSPTFIEKAVSGGLPRNALRHVAEALAGSDKARISALESEVVPRTTLDRRTTRLSPVESERTERIARLLVHARRALGTEEEAREFMTTPHPELDGRSPLEVAATDLGTRRAEQILNALEYGLAL